MNRSLNVGVSARVGTYSDAVEVVSGRRTLFVSGIPGLDAQSGAVPEGFAEQADLAWNNLKAILRDGGMGVGDIVKLTQYLVRREDLVPYREIRTRHLGGCQPASMLAFLPELVWPNMLIELEAVAAQ